MPWLEIVILYGTQVLIIVGCIIGVVVYGRRVFGKDARIGERLLKSLGLLILLVFGGVVLFNFLSTLQVLFFS